MARYLTAAEVEARMPGFLDEIERRGVAISNNAGALMVDGYLGDIFEAIAGIHNEQEQR